MLTATLKNFVVILLCAFVLGHSAGMTAFAFDGTESAGTVISNRAEATYRDDDGIDYSAFSPVVTVTIQAVASVNVTPDETAPSAAVGPQDRIVRVFRICNTGNAADSYTITNADVNAPATLFNLYFDNDNTGTVSPADTIAAINGSASSSLSPGTCLGVLAIVDTNDSPANSNLTIRLTARSNANGINRPEDNGTIINALGAGPRLTSPTDPNLPPLKTVNGSAESIVSTGSTFPYEITFRNNGDVAARNVVITDELPLRVEYVASSLTLENRALTDADDTDEGSVQNRRITFRLPTIAPGELVTVSFRARLNGILTPGVGVVNIATVSAQNVASTPSSAAVVVIDPFGIVFAGRAGGSAPIPGARVAILTDQDINSILNIPTAGFSPNLENVNPYATDAMGRFSFALFAEQLGTSTAPAHYFMNVSAQGYSTRMLAITVRPSVAGLFTLRVHALDGQPLAIAGGFDLIREDVSIDDLASIVLNIPMFEPVGLEISKSADRPRVEIGDAVAYRVEVHNPTAATVSNVVIHDRPPVSFHYASGTARLTLGTSTERPIEPEVSGSELLFRIGEIAPGDTARILYRVRVGANAGEGEQENVAIASGLFPNGERNQTQPVRATVMVGAGAFSTRQIIVGRVFVDENRNGKFDEGDVPLPEVRLFLHSGQSVVTDSQGLYNLPSLGDGSQVLSLDPITISSRYQLTDNSTLAARSWTRLLRTPLGGGALLRQNFALTTREGVSPEPSPVASGQSSYSPASSSDVTASPKPSATSFQVQLATDESFEHIVFDETVTSLQLTTTLAPGRYYRRVASHRSKVLTFSKPEVFEVKSSSTESFETTETLEPVAPGEVKVLTPGDKTIVMTAAMELEARVALDWKVKVEINGKVVSEKNIGTVRQDQKNSITTYTYVGLELKPGPNAVRVVAINPNGTTGNAQELMVLGRGPTRRLEIIPEKLEIQTGGRDYTTLRVRAFDQWGSPAADDQVALETSAGELIRTDRKAGEAAADRASEIEAASESNRSKLSVSVPGDGANKQISGQSQIIVPLVHGEATVRLIASGTPGEAKLHAQMGQTEAEARVRITAESRPAILVGLAEMTVGQSIPEVNLRGEEGHRRNRLSFFYSGPLGDDNHLTLSYDTQRPINRTAGRDRLFELDPLDRVYPIFGDSSTRYEAAQSNSKLYARLDRKRSFAMFGDFEADMEDLTLAGYARKLTGVKLHLENSDGDFVSVTGARPDTSFARDVFPAGGLGLLRLSHGEILPGSETVVLEIRDRRNPEIILSRETLSRSVDYNLNSITGELFFLRYISTFDYNLNLTQLVVTYEHRSDSMSSAVYTARGRKTFRGLGLQLGFAGVMQRQDETGSFVLGGIDGEKSLPNRGTLRFAFARSQGEIVGGGNFFDTGSSEHNGMAVDIQLNQPLSFYQGVIRARYSAASAGFLNPFGATVTAGSRRGEVSFELKPRSSTLLKFGLMDERNQTLTVNNSRLTFSAGWDEAINERIRLHVGYDHRSLEDSLTERGTESNLVTVGADIKVTDKLQVAVKREQNLGEADPTYPDQTTLAATYKVNKWAKLFFTQRLASAAITPIGDFSGSGAGFASSGARRETAFGVETRLGKYSSMVGRYQLENGINGTDSFAVIGLQNRLPINKEFSVELGFERGFHLAGNGESFNSVTVGLGWQPTKDFRSSARYEFRDRAGAGQLLAFGAAGRIRENITALTRFQFSRTAFEGRHGSSLEGTAALAYRPLKSDRAGLLFSFTHRSRIQDAAAGSSVATSDRLDSLSTDGYFQATDRLELYGRLALRLGANGQADLPFVSTFTYLTQGRAQYRLTRRFDWAVEMRRLTQPSSGTSRSVYGSEVGFWAMPDLRVGVGYNFSAKREPAGFSPLPSKSGFYFTLTSKLSSLFDLFGTSNNGLVGAGKEEQPSTGVPK
jgi:trimeric autotransporter adhesin